jgi:hypothetical protein
MIHFNIYNIVYINLNILHTLKCIHEHGYIFVYNIVNINLNCTHVYHSCKHFGNPNVHFHLMYLKHGSIIGLMVTPWVETCRHFNWQYISCDLTEFTFGTLSENTSGRLQLKKKRHKHMSPRSKFHWRVKPITGTAQYNIQSLYLLRGTR